MEGGGHLVTNLIIDELQKSSSESVLRPSPSKWDVLVY